MSFLKLFIKKHLLSAFLLSLFFLVIQSCNNSLSSELILPDNIYTNSKFITLNGCFEYDSEIEASAGRMAAPALPSGIIYFAKATAEGKSDVNGIVDIANRTFTIQGLEIGVEWTIQVGIKDASGVIIMSAQSSKTFSETDFSINQNFRLKPVSDQGNGSLLLSFQVPATVTKICFSCSDSNWNITELAVTNGSATLTGSLPSGSYQVNLLFKNASNLLLFSDNQIINVFQNMTTNRWDSNGKYIDTSGAAPVLPVYKINDTDVTTFCSATLYVGKPALLPDSVGVSNANSGNAYSPLATLNAAIERIKNFNSARDYTILVSGRITGLSSIPSDFSTSHASSILIQGLTGPDENGNPQDILDAESQGRCLAISSSVPVRIKDIHITGGKLQTTSGAGILVNADNAKLTLEGKTLVSGNTISTDSMDIKGGGIAIANNASVTLKDNVKITGNTGTSTGSGSCQGIGVALTDSNSKLYLQDEPLISGNILNTNTKNDLYKAAGSEIKVYGSRTSLINDADKCSIELEATLSRGSQILTGESSGALISSTWTNAFTFENTDWCIGKYGKVKSSQPLTISFNKNINTTTDSNVLFLNCLTNQTASITTLYVEEDDIAGTALYDAKSGFIRTNGGSVTAYRFTGWAINDNTNPDIVPSSTNKTYTQDILTSFGNGNSLTLKACWEVTSGAQEAQVWRSITYDTNNYDKLSTFKIYTDEQAKQIFSNLKNKNFENKTVSLENDVYLSRSGPGGTFNGTFNGNNKTINVSLTSNNTQGLALFRIINGTIQEVKLAGTINDGNNSNANIGGICTINNGTIQSCEVSVEITANNPYVAAALDRGIGGIAAKCYSTGVINGCTFKGSIVTKGVRHIGGIVGCFAGGQVTGCTMSGSITCSWDNLYSEIEADTQGNKTAIGACIGIIQLLSPYLQNNTVNGASITFSYTGDGTIDDNSGVKIGQFLGATSIHSITLTNVLNNSALVNVHAPDGIIINVLGL
ncbi:MAG: hypothetical protein K6A15_07910 [Treponema sp.]|nr:hypothetical protein [Treponema sp.]